MAGKVPKNDSVKHPWIGRDGDYSKPGKVSAKQKKANDELNEVAGLTKKPAAKKLAKKK